MEYQRSMELIPILCDAMSQAKHELAIFESLLALTQLASMGEQQQVLILTQPYFISNLQTNLMDDNQFIVQASLELIVNLSHCEKLQTHFKNDKGK